MAGRYATQTSVSVAKTRAEIEDVLTRYGADGFGVVMALNRARVEFTMTTPDTGRLMIRMELTLPNPNDDEFRYTPARRHKRDDRDAQRAWEQACRSSWRALLLVVKAKLEAVEVGISTIEREFMANIVLPNGQTMADQIIPQLPEAFESNGRPQLLLT